MPKLLLLLKFLASYLTDKGETPKFEYVVVSGIYICYTHSAHTHTEEEEVVVVVVVVVVAVVVVVVFSVVSHRQR